MRIGMDDDKQYLVLAIDNSVKPFPPEIEETILAVKKLGIQVNDDTPFVEICLELKAPLNRIQVRELFTMKDVMGRMCDFYEVIGQELRDKLMDKQNDL